MRKCELQERGTVRARVFHLPHDFVQVGSAREILHVDREFQQLGDLGLPTDLEQVPDRMLPERHKLTSSSLSEFVTDPVLPERSFEDVGGLRNEFLRETAALTESKCLFL